MIKKMPSIARARKSPPFPSFLFITHEFKLTALLSVVTRKSYFKPKRGFVTSIEMTESEY